MIVHIAFVGVVIRFAVLVAVIIVYRAIMVRCLIVRSSYTSK